MVIRTLQFFLVIWFASNAVVFSQNHPSETGWSLELTSTGDWKRQTETGELLVTPDHHLTASIPPHSSAEWVITTEPVWIYRFQWVEVKFRVSGWQNNRMQQELFFRSGSTGPVTPGAENAENPLAKSREYSFGLREDRVFDGEVYTVSALIYPKIETMQIDQIGLKLQSGGEPLKIEILELRFYDSNVRRGRKVLPWSDSVVENAKLGSPFETISLRNTFFPIAELSDTPKPLITIQSDGIPFVLNDDETVAVSSFINRDQLSVDINKPCSEVFLWMGFYTVGDDGAFNYQPRDRIRQPERIIVSKIYDDGTEDQSFPYHLGHGEYVIDATMGCYAIPADISKTLQRVEIREFMPYGQVILAGVTINTGEPVKPIAQKRYPVSIPPKPVEIKPAKPGITVENNRKFVIENAFYKCTFQSDGGLYLTELIHKESGENVLTLPSPLFSVMIDRQRVDYSQFQLASFNTSNDTLELVLRQQSTDSAVELALRFGVDSSNELRCGLRIKNLGYTPSAVRVRFPDIQHLRLSRDAESDYYLFPRRRAALGNAPVHVVGDYSGEFPLQFMDLYSQENASGIALHTRDLTLTPKRYLLEKNETGTRMAVEYGYLLPITLDAEIPYQTPSAVLQFHSGGWNVPFNRYKEWAKGWYKPNEKTRGVLRDVFVCRRDYPIGGTGYLFDVARNEYTFDRLIGESREDLGGIDMIDVSGWAYSETFGRVGEYERYELGGADSLEENITRADEDGIAAGLYFEGYLVDPRSTVGTKHGREWQIIDRDGVVKTWTGNDEIYMSPYAEGWRKYLSETMLRVADRVNADAVYLDQYGFANESKVSFSTGHGHEPGIPPLLGEHQMLQKVRETLDWLDHPVAVYIEQSPCDVTSQLVDAAFSYGMAGDRLYDSPTKMNLFRFAFPSFKLIELFNPGIDPKGVTAEDVKLAFFHGHAIWLKGRARSWYSAECRETIRKANRIFHDHVESFMSDDVEPHVPGLINGLYANRFSGERETVITLYNDTYHTLRGDLLEWSTESESARDEWGMKTFQSRWADGTLVLSGELHPHEIGCVVIPK